MISDLAHLHRFALTAITTLVACAPRATVEPLGEPIVDGRVVDAPARLLACSGYTEPTLASPRMQRVSVGVLVGSNGRVHEIEAPRLTSSPADLDTRLADSARAQAEDLAWECAFEPAQLGGQPVATWQTVSFRLAP